MKSTKYENAIISFLNHEKCCANCPMSTTTCQTKFKHKKTNTMFCLPILTIN